MSENRLKRTISSALWSAYGDALGFPTELASDRTVQQRLGHSRVSRTESWKRLVGGRFGAKVQLPAGAYSDDTQLRLSTCRAITGQGYFDVEAFAKIELPVWQSYALGAGRGSKSAASALCNRSHSWFSNFFVGYENGGGNGAAMRVQPHVWAAANLKNKDSFLPDVARNALCTHGHMRGVAGAIVHALSLAHTLDTGKTPGPEEWLDYATDIRNIATIVANDNELSTFWQPTWEEKSGRSLSASLEDTANEWQQSVRNARELIEKSYHADGAIVYAQLIALENGLSKEERGSGLKCALFANVAAFIAKRYGSQETIETVANLLDSDTDTIATMAGALIGAANPEARFIGPIQDSDYITEEASRMYEVSQRGSAATFNYPDTLYWQAPRAVIDMLSCEGNQTFIEGLGNAVATGEPYSGMQKNTAWRWFRLSFGQSVLVRYRAAAALGTDEPGPVAPVRMDTPDMFQQTPISAASSARKDLSAQANPAKLDEINLRSHDREPSVASTQYSEMSEPAEQHPDSLSESIPMEEPIVSTIDLDALTNEAIKGFDPETIGRHLLFLAEQPNAISLSIAYTSIVIKARSARLKHRKTH
ncbi:MULTISPECIES: ADP-ribosylglycohydrolase family protein [Pseudomonas]|uniref:ADP-ribosylglycohydrolase family protein n=1 Tax=Pseudomonas quercus TaxID=2722792 RepID=A0ABX0YF97_9PSED|nr:MULTISPECIES: ADP-ribosylglycohydrolase family protein [Pseudomonas]MBF7143273.1 ADP-ribosylglycohydrolase family protein [Pseudomonas sp. LY10J]NJP01577.1 ADP-ribosylglycohydrolase family protein [Pseudomonas quercus]